jgi:hypothetical protein
MKLSQLVSSVFVGLLAGLVGPVVVAVIRAGVEISHLGQDPARTARTAKRFTTSPHARTGTDSAVVVKMPEARRQDKESRRAA